MERGQKDRRKLKGPLDPKGVHQKTSREGIDEERARLQSQILDAIVQAHTCFISNMDSRETFDSLLKDLLALTRSEYGFIGEVLYTSEGQPYLKTHAITNICWDEKTRAFYDQYAPEGMEFYNLKTLFGAVMVSREPVISNDPAHDPRGGGTPEGHPPLDAFLGIPIKIGDKLVAMAGVANRAGGYDRTQIGFLQPFLTTIGQLIEARRGNLYRRKLEGELRETLAELSAIHQNAPILILVVDRERRVRRVYGPASLFADRPEEEMLDLRVGEVLRCLHHLDDPQGCGFSPDCATCEVRHAVLQTFSTGRSLRNIEAWLSFSKEEGVERRCLLVNTAFLRGDHEERVLVCLQDLTEMKRTEAELRFSQEMIFKAFQANPAWLVISSLEEGRYLEVNEAFLKSTGFSREEIIGRTALELGIWANPDQRASLVSQLKEKESVRNKEVTLRNKLGEPLDVLLSAEVIEIEGMKYMLFASLDITDKKRAEEALKASEEKYRTLVEESLDAIVLLDPERRIVSCNRAFCDLFGYDRHEVEGRSIRIVHPSDESFRSFENSPMPL